MATSSAARLHQGISRPSRLARFVPQIAMAFLPLVYSIGTKIPIFSSYVSHSLGPLERPPSTNGSEGSGRRPGQNEKSERTEKLIWLENRKPPTEANNQFVEHI
jgi:hypothetical protein